jgi:hypothetical protein
MCGIVNEKEENATCCIERKKIVLSSIEVKRLA